MESESKKGGNELPDIKPTVEATVVEWLYPDQFTVPLPPPAVSTLAMTPLSDGPSILPRPPGTTLQETPNLIRSTSFSCGGMKSSRSTNEACLHAPPVSGVIAECPSTPPPVSQVAKGKTSGGSTKPIKFVTVIVPLTRLPESVLKRANPHITLPLGLSQPHAPDFPDSASIPSYFEERSPQSQPVKPSNIIKRGNIIHHSVVNDLFLRETATPEPQLKVVGIPTGIGQDKFESATPASPRRLSGSSHSTITSIEKDIVPSPSQTAPHQSKGTNQPLSKTIFQSQPILSSQRQYKPTSCVFCEKIFGRCDIFFYDHLRSHIQEVSLECPDCGKGFIKEHSYKVHLTRYCRVRNKEKLHSCPVCQKSFHTEFNLQVHFQIHSSQRKLHRCSGCPATFKSRQGLRLHKKAKHEKERKKCEECGTLLASQASLRQHLGRHRNIKAHSCLFCTKAFFNNQDLFKHLRSHTKEAEIRAAVHSCTFCGRRFTRRQHLHCHLCWHIREKWHACNFCGQQFTSKRATLGHIDRCHLGK